MSTHVYTYFWSLTDLLLLTCLLYTRPQGPARGGCGDHQLRTGRSSIIVLCLGGIIGLAVVLLTTLGVLKVVADVQDGQPLWGFSLGAFVCDNNTATNRTSTRR